tara:strand:- start:10853 stop:11143 length:291 start_codon:yes stop_codon:yes gene_type:complete
MLSYPFLAVVPDEVAELIEGADDKGFIVSSLDAKDQYPAPGWRIVGEDWWASVELAHPTDKVSKYSWIVLFTDEEGQSLWGVESFTLFMMGFEEWI